MARRMMGIVVLGCPSMLKGTTSQMFEQRVLKTYELFNDNRERDPLVICTGYQIPGTTEPQALALRRSLITAGIPAENIIAEAKSRSTLENAVMSKPILDEHGVKEVAVVTNKFHVNRSKYIFEGMCTGYELSFSAAPNGVTPEQLDQLAKLESRKMVNIRPKMMAYGID